ncbi:MAG: hypothetical protein ACREEK_00250 [Bradyrhizobium sp.]
MDRDRGAVSIAMSISLSSIRQDGFSERIALKSTGVFSYRRLQAID